MSVRETILRSRRVVTPSGLGPASVHIRGGSIVRVSGFEDVPAGAPVVDYDNNVIMPGLVDSHVHVNEPGRTEWEGFESATRAAAAGGITTIVDMPLNSIPPTTSVAHLEKKLAALEGKCWVDVALWGGAVPGNSGDLRPMLEAGVAGFKCFLLDSGVAEFGHLAPGDLELVLRTLSGSGAPLLVHAELAGPIDAARPEGAAGTYGRYLQSRPPAAEVEAIELVARLCEETGSRAHIVHLSAAEGLDAVRKGRDRGAALSAETTPHYLHFEAESIPDGATEYKCAPPIRERENREKLWKGLADATIDLIVSDHSPCTPALKKGDFLTSWGGISSLQLVLPVIWTEASRRGHDLRALTRWLCEGPARLAGLDGRKGKLDAGYDADLVVWNPDASFTVSAEGLHHRHKVSPYIGEMLEGVVKETWVRGRRVFRDGRFEQKGGGWVRGGR